MKELDVQGTAIQESRTKIIIAAAKELGLSTQWNSCMRRCCKITLDYFKFAGGSDGRESTCGAGDLALILDWEVPLEEGMATHSSVVAWRIPWAEEPGGLQAIESGTRERLSTMWKHGKEQCDHKEVSGGGSRTHSS